MNTCRLSLQDGLSYEGSAFGAECSAAGEIVFNTGMVGYQESLTDPSYKGQILCFTYPIIGSYGVPEHVPDQDRHKKVLGPFESERIQVSALIVSEHVFHYSHWKASKSLDTWLKEFNIPGIFGVDTRALTKHLRSHGSILGKLEHTGQNIDYYDPNIDNVVAQTSTNQVVSYPAGKKTVVVIDCGLKNSIIASLLARNISVLRVPWNYDFLKERFDGLLITNGPGNPTQCGETIENIRRAMELKLPIFGICLGHQLLALAAGAKTYKLKFGHRSQNQPVIEVGTNRCFMSAQNHGFAVNEKGLVDWETWFTNANDQSNEGIKHRFLPFSSVQFHPEAVPGPVDTHFLFDRFLAQL